MITAQRALKAAGKHASRAALALKSCLGAPSGHFCPACNAHVVGFFRYGDCAHWGCPACGASPRERLVNHLIDNGALALPKGGAILHMAPNEASLVERFRDATRDYTPADIDPSRYDVEGVKRVDLMNIGETERFDLFYASHVMEHVPDDMIVLANIFKALKPGAEAWLMVPLWDKLTEDGGPDLSGRERERRYGQWDHVRQYGLDFADRIARAGFEVSLLRAEDYPAELQDNMALGETLFRARRPERKG